MSNKIIINRVSVLPPLRVVADDGCFAETEKWRKKMKEEVIERAVRRFESLVPESIKRRLIDIKNKIREALKE